MVKFHTTLSEGSIYSRYFEFLKLDQRIAHERLARLCFIDYDREMALVAEVRDPDNGGQKIVGIGRLIKGVGTNTAEFALLIGDGWQSRGLGTLLLNLLVQIGRDERLVLITGEILPDNLAMKLISTRCGFRLGRALGDGVVLAQIKL
jgi:acetyltransferase